MKEIVSDPTLVAYCGLYCGACKLYLKDRCPGCHENTKAAWCKIRTCCQDNNYTSCAMCTTYTEVMSCKKYNNIISKMFGLLFRSNRSACISQIKEAGMQAHADNMAATKLHTIKK